jgi:hypothetical protein
MEDCREDPDIGVTDSNSSRPSTRRATRHPNGTMITRGEWAAIKASSRMIASELRNLNLKSTGSQQILNQKTQGYFSSYFEDEWMAALLKLEKLQPLLALCLSHWKAACVLGNTLLSKANSKLSKVDYDTSDSETDQPSKKRPHSPNSSEKTKRSRTGRKGILGDKGARSRQRRTASF